MHCELYAFLGNLNRGFLITHLEYGHVDLRTNDLQLLDSCGTVHVTRDQKGTLALLFVHQRKLTCVGGFTRTLQTHHHNDCGRLGGNGQLGLRAAHQSGQLLVDDLDDLLSGIECFHDLGTNGTLGHGIDKGLDHLEVNVRLEQRKLDLAHTGLDVRLGQFPLVFEFFEGIAQFFA